MTDDIHKYFIKPNLLFNFSSEEHSLSEEWNNYITTWNKIYSENKNIIAVPNVINSQYVNWLIGTKERNSVRDEQEHTWCRNRCAPAVLYFVIDEHTLSQQ